MLPVRLPAFADGGETLVVAFAKAFQKSLELKSTPFPTAVGEVAGREGVFWPVPE